MKTQIITQEKRSSSHKTDVSFRDIEKVKIKKFTNKDNNLIYYSLEFEEKNNFSTLMVTEQQLKLLKKEIENLNGLEDEVWKNE